MSKEASISIQVVGKDHYFESFDGEILYAKEKYAILEHRFPKVVICFPPCIYSHHFFDCPISDYSLMNHLTQKGFKVFAYDPRGFGSSYRPADGRSITYEVELKDAKALVDFVMAESGERAVSMVAFGSGSQVACGHALRHPKQVDALALMDFVWKVFPEPLPSQFQEMLLSQPNGYLQTSLVTNFFDELLHLATPEVRAWVNSTFTEAPIGPFLTAFEPMPLIKPVDQVQASILIIRGTQAGITSEADSFDFLRGISSQVRAIDVLEGAGPIPSLEKNHYQLVLKDITWFLSR